MNWFLLDKKNYFKIRLYRHAIRVCDGEKSFSICRSVQPVGTKGSLEFLYKEIILKFIQAV
jgi:hypothetical protein